MEIDGSDEHNSRKITILKVKGMDLNSLSALTLIPTFSLLCYSSCKAIRDRRADPRPPSPAMPAEAC
jgi:hypothetical protein